MKKFYQFSIEETLADTGSNLEGLTNEEAEKRIVDQGKNILEQKKKKGPLTVFLRQFKNMMIILLILVGIVSTVYAVVNHESLLESIVIFACVLVNAIMGFVQEMKGENAIEALKTLSSSSVKVQRDGEWQVIDAENLVVGDIISLEAGDKVPADCRIISCVGVKADESVLTGESLSVDKDEEVMTEDALLQDRHNLIYSGTNIASGRLEAVVIATGMNTEIGSIAKNLDKKEDPLTPLQVKVNKVSGFITVIACV